MHDLSVWSLNLGRWAGIPVRLHAFFLLFAVCTLYLSTLTPAAESGYAGQDGGSLIWIAAASLAVLFVSVLLHELGHCFAAVRLGGRVQQIVIGPLGGLAEMTVPHQPRHELLSALSGPLVNLILALATVPLLVALGEGSAIAGLLHPLWPQSLANGPQYLVVIRLVFWLNWVLVLINLLPAFPLDGGRIMRALLWPSLGYRTAALVAARIAKFTALGICLGAWLLRDGDPSPLIPAWLPLTLIAIFVYFSANHQVARQQQRSAEEELSGYDFSQGYLSLDRQERRRGPGLKSLLKQWRANRKAARLRARRRQEQAEEAHVDSILARLHTSGIESLSADDRALLQRVSNRYRNRM